MAQQDAVTAQEATRLLGIKLQTLYAYASRGTLRKVERAGDARAYYSREDVERLRMRQAKRRAQPGQASGPLDWVSTVSSTSAQGPMYRGHLFRSLVLHPGTLESVAELLWSGVPVDESIVWDFPAIPASVDHTIESLRGPSGELPLMRALSAAAIALGQSASAELKSGITTLLARRAVCAFAGCLGILGPGRRFVMPVTHESVASTVLRGFGRSGTPQELAAINSMLITCAEDGFSPSTLAVRMAASTGAGMHACLLAGFGAHSGHLLGGRCDRIEDFFHWKFDAQDARHELLRRGDASIAATVGFGPRVGAVADPRGEYLIGLADVLHPAAMQPDAREMIDAMARRKGLRPSMELGLVVLALALGLPRRSASALWALGSSVGWIAHLQDERINSTCARMTGTCPNP